MSQVFGYVTTSNEAEAEAIGRMLVEKRLAACVNWIAGVRSIYRWEGKVESGQEVVLIFKTQAKHTAAISALVKAMHSSVCPCVVTLAIEGGHPEFLKWIEENT